MKSWYNTIITISWIMDIVHYLYHYTITAFREHINLEIID